MGAIQDEIRLAARCAPILVMDRHEPFLPCKVGYTIIDRDATSPSADRFVDLYVNDAVRARRVIEYAIYYDWDIGHLYELEHLWVYLNARDEVVRVDGSWHGTYHLLASVGHESFSTARKVFVQPGKHAHARSPHWFEPREAFADACTRKAGNGGLLVTRLFQGLIAPSAEADRLAAAYLKSKAFEPSFVFDREFALTEEMFMPWPELRAWIPDRIRHWVDALR